MLLGIGCVSCTACCQRKKRSVPRRDEVRRKNTSCSPGRTQRFFMFPESDRNGLRTAWIAEGASRAVCHASLISYPFACPTFDCWAPRRQDYAQHRVRKRSCCRRGRPACGWAFQTELFSDKWDTSQVVGFQEYGPRGGLVGYRRRGSDTTSKRIRQVLVALISCGGNQVPLETGTRETLRALRTTMKL